MHPAPEKRGTDLPPSAHAERRERQSLAAKPEGRGPAGAAADARDELTMPMEQKGFDELLARVYKKKTLSEREITEVCARGASTQ